MLAAIVTGRDGGSWSGTSGITSSVAAADSARGVPRSVGWLEEGDGSVTFAYAAPGDTNLDWSIDILDAANILALGKFDTGTAASWLDGDFSYDGLVDILDVADFVATGLFNAGDYNPLPAAGMVATVPEPTVGLVTAVMAALAFVARSRRC
jgi:hypothetical protein